MGIDMRKLYESRLEEIKYQKRVKKAMRCWEQLKRLEKEESNIMDKLSNLKSWMNKKISCCYTYKIQKAHSCQLWAGTDKILPVPYLVYANSNNTNFRAYSKGAGFSMKRSDTSWRLRNGKML